MSTDNSNNVPHAQSSINGNGADKLTGLVGVWRQVANFGLTGLLAALLGFLVYAQRQDIDTFKADARDAHAEIGKLTAEMSRLTSAVHSLEREMRRERQARDPD